jgi:hypothetical protein
MSKFLLLSLASLSYATDLLVPLYPPPSAWGPVATAVANNPTLTAKIIINPSNGPSVFPPSSDFQTGASTLSSNANVQLIGYVHTSNDLGVTRCQRPVDDVKADIRTWSQWNTLSGVSIHGIFIDEAPIDGSNNCTAYMQDLTNFIKNDASLLFTSPRIVVFNPGSPGIGGLGQFYTQSPPPDLIVALETCFTVPASVIAGDGCPAAGGYERYDNEGYGGSIDTYLAGNVGVANYPRTAIIVHGFHDTNGPQANLVANASTLLQEILTVRQKNIGAAFFNTMEYMTFNTGPADIGTVAADLAAANQNPPSRRFKA